VLGLSDCDGDGVIQYKEFAAVCAAYIEESYQFDTQVKKDEIMKACDKNPEHTTHPAARDLDHLELFRTFKKYDRNMNGTLDFGEYTQCLTECPDIELTKEEIITVAMAADLNNDGEVDFEEFMKHFPTVLNMIQYNKHMNNRYADVLQEEMKRRMYAHTNLDGVGDTVK
jgi:hypothetical protein